MKISMNPVFVGWAMPTMSGGARPTALLVLCMLLAPVAQAASFDCGKAQSKVEHLICGDDKTSELDEMLGKVYALALEDSADKAEAKKEQKQWLKEVRDACADAACLNSAYRARIQALAAKPQYQKPQSVSGSERMLGVCGIIDNEARKDVNGETYLNSVDFYAAVEAEMYLWHYEQRNDITQEDEFAAKATILSQPKHGTLVEDSTLRGSYRYSPNAGYYGKDSAEVLVEIKGMKVKVRYFIHATEYNEPNAYEDYCEQPGGQWKISQASDTNRILTASSQ